MKNLYRHIFAIVAGLISLIVYITTLNPTVTFMDSGELAAACTTFGIPHPTGYPLYLVIGYIFSGLPFSQSPIYNLNLLSAVLSVAAVTVFFYCSVLVIELLKDTKGHKPQKQKKVSPAAELRRLSDLEKYSIAFFPALVFGFSRTFWSNANSVEVYPLHVLFLVILIYYCLKIYLNLKAEISRNWVLLFLFTGLSFSNHLTTVFILPGVLFIYYLQYKENPVFAKSLRIHVLYVMPGLLLYLILMIRALSQPYLNWSNPSNFPNLMHHISGGDYSQLMFSSSSVFSKNAGRFFSSVLSEFAIISGVLAVAGLIYLYLRNRNLFYFLLILMVSCLLYSLNYNIRDLLTYFMPVYVSLGLAFTGGLTWLSDYVSRSLLLGKSSVAVAAVIGLILAGISFSYNYSVNDNSSDYAVEDVTLNILNETEPNSILMTYDWGYVYPAAIYYQQVGKFRTDLKVFNVKFLSVPWYLEMIRKYYPDVYQNCRNEIDYYIATEGSSTAGARLSTLVKAFIAKNFAKYPIYMTYDFAYSNEIKPMISDYLTQPSGLIYKLVSKSAPYDQTAGINSLSLTFRRFEPNTEERRKVHIFTAGIYYDNAVYHNSHKNAPLAMKFLEKALELRNDFTEAVSLRSQILKEIRGK